MIKQIYIMLFMALLLAGIGSAATVNLISPANNTVLAVSNLAAKYNVSGNQSSWNCKLYTDQDGTWSVRETDSGVANWTNNNFTRITGISDKVAGGYNWDVFCNGITDPVGDWGVGSNVTLASGNSVFGIDTVSPSLNITPANNVWDTDGAIIIGGTVIDNNPVSCVITSTINTTGNSTQSSAAYTALAYTNNTQFNFTGFSTGDTNMVDNNTNAYSFSVSCNDSAGNTGIVSTRYIPVDTTAPRGFDFNATLWRTSGNVLITNNTYSNDYTPQIGWNASYDLNFSRYEVEFYNSSGTVVRTNVSSVSTLAVNVSALGADNTYTINVTAYDAAGNFVSMTSQNTYKYSTTSTGRALTAGWSAIMNTGNARTLSSYLNLSGANTVSYFNSTHEFVSHVSGGANGGTSIPYGEAVFIFLNASGTYENEVRNVSAGGLNFNLTNQSTLNWNIPCNRNTSSSFTFQKLNNYFNSAAIQNVSFMSYFDWSASAGSKYVPFKGNWTINNGTTVNYGACTWAFLDTGNLAHNSSFLQINWNKI